MVVFWEEQKARLKDSNALEQFNEQLAREWAIETGIIERLYTIDRGTTRMLIEKGLEASLIPHGATGDKPAGMVMQIVQSQADALEGAFGFIKQERELSTSFIKELHAVITKYQPTTEAKTSEGVFIEVELLRGDWKKHPNNPKRPDGEIHFYSPPEQVASEIDNLIAWHLQHVEKGVPSVVEAAWLHHRFTQIHPFQDGNGRVVRTLASLIFIKAGWFPLVINRDQRLVYIEALEKADSGDLLPLVRLFTEIQVKTFNKATSIEEALPELILHDSDPVKQMISAIGEQVRERQKKEQEEREKRTKIARLTGEILKQLWDVTEQRFKAVANSLNEIGELQKALEATVTFDSDPSIGESFKFLTKYNFYYILLFIKMFNTNKNFELHITFHFADSEVLNTTLITPKLKLFNAGDTNEPDITLDPLTEPFQFAYNEDKEAVGKRFEIWLNEVLLEGLNRWRQQL